MLEGPPLDEPTPFLSFHLIPLHRIPLCVCSPPLLSPPLQGWYAEAKVWADEKCLHAWEATSMADDAEDI